MESDATPDATRQGLSRRQLIRGGVAGAGLLWVAPIVSGVGLTTAAAASGGGTPSETPSVSGSTTQTQTTSTSSSPSPTPEPTVQGETFTKPTPTPTVQAVTTTKPTSGNLPFTGAPVDALALAAAGLLAAGGAAYAGSKMRARQAGVPAQRDGDVEPEPPAA